MLSLPLIFHMVQVIGRGGGGYMAIMYSYNIMVLAYN